MSETNRIEDKTPQLYDEEEVQEWFESQEEITQPKSAPTELSIEEKYARTQLRIVRTTMDFSLHNLRQSLDDSSYINLSPTYQRRHRWDIKKRSQLIESFLMNIPIPPIFLFENDYNRYEVMDGRQRLQSIKDFLNNLFALRGLDFWKELEGLRFKELPSTIQRGLLRRTLSAVVLLAETTQPDDSEIDVRMILFKRLNTGGIQLNPQELRNALYPCPFNDLLISVSRSDLFCDIWRIPRYTPDEEDSPQRELTQNTLYKSMADCELVLRFFAIRETLELDLKGSLRRLMDQCMIRHFKDTEDEVRKLKQLYQFCLEKLYRTFDNQPFMLPKMSRPSRPLYDALMVAMSRNQEYDPLPSKTNILKRLRAAANDPEKYEILVGRGNTIEAVKERVTLAEWILLG